eukprot:1161601-Pelagomonas_calceolata.AAC.11
MELANPRSKAQGPGEVQTLLAQLTWQVLVAQPALQAPLDYGNTACSAGTAALLVAQPALLAQPTLRAPLDYDYEKIIRCTAGTADTACTGGTPDFGSTAG